MACRIPVRRTEYRWLILLSRVRQPLRHRQRPAHQGWTRSAANSCRQEPSLPRQPVKSMSATLSTLEEGIVGVILIAGFQ